MQNRAAQFVDTVSRHLTAGCVLEAMGSALNDIGIDCFCMNLLAAPKQQFEEVILASKLPSDWINLYKEKAYGEDDPSQRHSKRVVSLRLEGCSLRSGARTPRIGGGPSRKRLRYWNWICRSYPRLNREHRQCLDGRL